MQKAWIWVAPFWFGSRELGQRDSALTLNLASFARLLDSNKLISSVMKFWSEELLKTWSLELHRIEGSGISGLLLSWPLRGSQTVLPNKSKVRALNSGNHGHKMGLETTDIMRNWEGKVLLEAI